MKTIVWLPNFFHNLCFLPSGEVSFLFIINVSPLGNTSCKKEDGEAKALCFHINFVALASVSETVGYVFLGIFQLK